MRVLIVGHQPLWREALAALVTDALSADSVITVARLDDSPEGRFDLLLLEPPLPDDTEAWLLAGAQISAARRLLVAPTRNLALARAAHCHGFNGLLPKDAERPLMVAILRLVMAGGDYFPCFEEMAISSPFAANPPIDRLSKRQQEVWAEMQHGRTNKEIAKALGISVATVKLHVQAILSAAGARNRTEAVSRLKQNTAQDVRPLEN